MIEARKEIERTVQTALETYSNVHRGSGHHSLVSTRLFDQARDVVLRHLGLDARTHLVVFCTPRRARTLTSRLAPRSHVVVSSADVGLPVGLRAVAVRRSALPGDMALDTGGGTARLVAPSWVVWARGAERFEAGTPPVVNVVAFAKALLARRAGSDVQEEDGGEPLTAAEILHHDELSDFAGRELLEKLRQTLIGRAASVPTADGARTYVNLDNAASTPTFRPIWDAVRRTWRQSADVQQEVVRETRALCAKVLGAPLASYEVVFTSNTTEAINLAARGLANEREPGVESVVVNTLLEHNSNELPWRALPGVSLVRMSVDEEGFLDQGALDSLLSAYNTEGRHGRKRVRLLAVSGASNVHGALNDLAAIGRIARQHGVRLLVDAAQLVAHRRVEMESCGIDYLAFSGHKAYAPFGSGALVARRGLLRLSPEETEIVRASGDENVLGIAALGKALSLLQRIGLDRIEQEERALTARLLRGLAQIPRVRVYGVRGVDSPRFADRGAVVAFDLKGRLPQRVAEALAQRGGIGVRFGCLCAHMPIKRLLRIPRFLEEFQRLLVTLFPRLALPGVARVSLGLENSVEDVDTFLRVLGEIARQRRRRDRRLALEIETFVRSAAERVYAPARP